MSNTVSYSYDINYISQQKKILVGRNNNTIYQKFKLDNRIQDTYYFQLVSKNNQLVELSGFDYQFFGSYIDAKQTLHVLFFSDEYTIENNVLSFKVNTYTNQYLNYVKVPREIELTIKKKANNLQQVILRDTGLAYPSPIIPGQEPTEVIAGFGLDINGFLISLTGTVLSGDNSTIAINDNVISYIGPSGNTYTAGEGIGISDQNVISLTATIPLSTSQLINDNHYISGIIIDFDSDTITSSRWEFFDDFKYQNDKIKLDYDVVSGRLLNRGFALTGQIPTSTSQLTNDSGFITNSDLANYATTGMLDTVSAAIPLSTSQLTDNTSNKIRYNQDTEWHDNTWALGYDPIVDIYHTKNRCDSTGKIRIRPMSGYTLNVGQGFVVQQWMYVDNTNLETEDPLEFYIDEYDENNIQLIGDWPDTVENHKVYAFVRRVIRQDQSNYVEHISFTSLIPNNN